MNIQDPPSIVQRLLDSSTDTQRLLAELDRQAVRSSDLPALDRVGTEALENAGYIFGTLARSAEPEPALIGYLRFSRALWHVSDVGEAIVHVVEGRIELTRDNGLSEPIVAGESVEIQHGERTLLKPAGQNQQPLALLVVRTRDGEPSFEVARNVTPVADAPYYIGYDIRYAKTYEAGGVLWETAEPNPVVVEIAGTIVPSGGTILDLGCGEGRDSLWLSAQGFDVTGVDVSRAALDRAREIAKERGLHARFVERDVIYLRNLPDDHFDLALNMGCLHMLDEPAHRREHLRRTHEVLKPGGSFLVNHCRQEWLKGFWSVEDYEKVKDARPGDVIPRRIRLADGTVTVIDLPVLNHDERSEEALSEELTDAGFEIVRTLSEDRFTFGNAAILLARKPGPPSDTGAPA
ncbi:MAG: methyltransferase domain-containing protein [Azospirillaceae bacterium]